MKARQPQLNLRLDTAPPDTAAQWRAGSTIAYLGQTLTLVLDTDCRLPERVGNELHLPLPPAATSRQIHDAAESWLRDEALRVFSAVVSKSALAGRRSAPRIVLAYGKRGDWARHDGGDGELLRCHWRLIEQSPAVIEEVLEKAAAITHPNATACDDLFATA